MTKIAGVVLAGGRSSRMGAPKALALLAGAPLLSHVLDRLGPQVGSVYLNAPDRIPPYRAFGRPIVEDAPERRGGGPLAGIAAALARARLDGFEWLATAPCDAPFLPLDLVARLAAPIAFGAPAAVAVSIAGIEPLFALWPVASAGIVEAALAAGRAGPRRVLAEMGAARVDFAASEDLDPFANLNTPEDLAAASGRAR